MELAALLQLIDKAAEYGPLGVLALVVSWLLLSEWRRLQGRRNGNPDPDTATGHDLLVSIDKKLGQLITIDTETRDKVNRQHGYIHLLEEGQQEQDTVLAAMKTTVEHVYQLLAHR
tara:strand:+ start:112 stop:459 length:348 start_codon:yes stop_codon:yes gene_type:complete